MNAPPLEFTLVDCPRCGLYFAITKDYEKRRRQDHQSFQCPEGHWQAYSAETEVDRLRRVARERDNLIIRLQNERADLEARFAKRKRK